MGGIVNSFSNKHKMEGFKMKKGFIVLLVCIISIVFMKPTDLFALDLLDYTYNESCSLVGARVECSNPTGDSFSTAKNLGNMTHQYNVVFDVFDEYDWVKAIGSIPIQTYNNRNTMFDRRDVYSFEVSEYYNIDVEIDLTMTNHSVDFDLDLHLIKFNGYNIYHDLDDGNYLDGSSIVGSSIKDENYTFERVEATLSPGLYYVVIDGNNFNESIDSMDYELEVKRTSKTPVENVVWEYDDWEDYKVAYWENDLIASDFTNYTSLSGRGLTESDLNTFYNQQSFIGSNSYHYSKVSYFFDRDLLVESRNALRKIEDLLEIHLDYADDYNGKIDKVLDVSFIAVKKGTSTVTKAVITTVLKGGVMSNPVVFVVDLAVSKVVLPALKEVIADNLKLETEDLEVFSGRVTSALTGINTYLQQQGSDCTPEAPCALREMVYFNNENVEKYFYQVSDETSINNEMSLNGYFPDPDSGAGLYLNFNANDTIGNYFDESESVYQSLQLLGTPNYQNVANQMLVTPGFRGSFQAITEESYDSNNSLETAEKLTLNYRIEETPYQGGNAYFEPSDNHVYQAHDYYTGYNVNSLTLAESQKYISGYGNFFDDEYYEFDINAAHSLRINTSVDNPSLNLYVYRKTDDGMEYVSSASGSTQFEKVYMLSKGEYYIKVIGNEDLVNEEDESNYYSFNGTLDFISKNNTYNLKDNTVTDGHTVSLEYVSGHSSDYRYGSYRGYTKDIEILDASGNLDRFGDESPIYNIHKDTDYVKFTLSGNRNVNLLVENVSENKNMTVKLYRSNGSLVKSSYNLSESFEYDHQLADGEYYLEIKSYGTTNTDENLIYDVKISTTLNKAPVITLNGDSIQYIEKLNMPQSYYSDPGAKVTDDQGTNITIYGTGTVYINSKGEYNRSYTYTDNFGLTTTVNRKVRVYEEKDKYKLQEWVPYTSSWVRDYDDYYVYFTSYASAHTDIDGSEKISYTTTTTERSYKYYRQQYYDKVCFQKYRNDTTFGSDWNYTDEKIGGIFCRWVNTASTSDIGDNDNGDRYENVKAFTYIGDTYASTYSYADKQDVKNTDNAYYYKVTSVTYNNYLNPNKTLGYTGWITGSKYDGKDGDYEYDYSYYSRSFTDVNGTTQTKYRRYKSFRTHYYLNVYYRWEDSSPAVYKYATTTPASNSGEQYVLVPGANPLWDWGQ